MRGESLLDVGDERVRVALALENVHCRPVRTHAVLVGEGAGFLAARGNDTGH